MSQHPIDIIARASLLADMPIDSLRLLACSGENLTQAKQELVGLTRGELIHNILWDEYLHEQQPPN